MSRIIRTLRRIMPFLPHSARRFLWWFSVLSAVLSIVDVIALMLLAVTVSSALQGGMVQIPILGSVGQGSLPMVILVLSLLIIGKSAAALLLQWYATRTFASFELSVGDNLFDAYIRAPWTDRLGRNSAQIVQMADSGIANVVAGFLLPVTTLPGMVVTAVGAIAVIVVAQPLTALVATVYLGGIAVIQYAVLGRRTRRAGLRARDSALRVAALISGMVSALKEITLRNKTEEVAAVVHANRSQTAHARANVSFLSSVPKFIFDAAVIGGFILTGGVAYLAEGIDGAVSAVALFGVAGFRLVPSLTGFQGVITRTVTAEPYIDMVIGDIEQAREYEQSRERLGSLPLEREPEMLVLDGVDFTYPGAEEPSIRDISLRIPIGSTVGIVGSSGAGKTTLVDILLGLLVPSSGTVTLDGQHIQDVLAAWRTRVGYVPQDVALFDGTVAQNVSLSWGAQIDHDRVERALRRAQLWPTIVARPGGMDAHIGERGITLSGGQRQRLGIARALYADPLVIVLDEATSALDTKTEADVSAAIRSLHGEVTIVSVAHRLSTIRDADLVCYMESARIAAQGTFSEVVAASPRFAQQATLAGLIS